jgi:hypothetical protein
MSPQPIKTLLDPFCLGLIGKEGMYREALVNDEGNKVWLGKPTRNLDEDGSKKYYCGQSRTIPMCARLRSASSVPPTA